MPDLLRWRNAVFALFLVNGAVSATWAARLPAVRIDTGSDLQAIGLALLGGAVGAIAGLSIGPLVMHRFGAKRALLGGFAGMFIGILAVGIGSSLLGSIVAVAGGALIWGLSMGAADVVTNIEAAANEREIGKTLMPLMHAFFSVGTVLGALGGSAAAAAGWSVLLNIGVVVGASVLLTLWALPGIPNRDDLEADGERQSTGERLRENGLAWRSPIVLLIGIGVLANGFAEGGANDWLAIGAVDGHGLSQATGALLFGVFVAGMTLVRLVGGPAVDRWGRVQVLRVSAAAALVGLSLYIWGTEVPLLVIGCLLWGAGVSLGFPLGMSAAADGPNGPARVSVVSSLGYGAFLIGPPALGFIGHAIGILPALTVFIGLLTIAALVAPAAREASGPHARTS
ncbi:MAG TPA: MFS transporter [Microbacteriaceae bacterium]|nr:MFS transporter [Microbacteriaceae bacterium]